MYKRSPAYIRIVRLQGRRLRKRAADWQLRHAGIGPPLALRILAAQPFALKSVRDYE